MDTKSISVKKKNLDLKLFKNRSAKVDDCSEFIKDSCKLFIDGKLAVVYLAGIKDARLDKLRNSLMEIQYSKSTRTSGMVTTSRIFGYAPRNPLRNHTCRSTTLASEDPKNHAAICDASSLVEEFYRKENPDLYSKHFEVTQEKLQDNWRMNKTVFTSGIANDCNPLRYHFDTGNYVGVWSGMIVLKKHITGGYLAVPEIDTVFECSDKSIILFDGQGLLHGVTPITKEQPSGKRFSVVYYSLKGMWQCLEINDEIARMRIKRTEVESKKKGRLQ